MHRIAEKAGLQALIAGKIDQRDAILGEVSLGDDTTIIKITFFTNKTTTTTVKVLTISIPMNY